MTTRERNEQINRIQRYQSILEKRSKDENWGWWVGFLRYAADKVCSDEWMKRGTVLIFDPLQVLTTDELKRAADLLESWAKFTRVQMARLLRQKLDDEGYPRPPYRVYTPMLSAFEEHRRQTISDNREDYVPMVWTMQQLVGTSWRNIYNGSLTKIVALDVNRFGHPVLYSQDETFDRVSTIGLWYKCRYVIDNYVRVDQLPPIRQLEWMTAYITSACNTKPALLDEIHRFADRHGLIVPPNLLNRGIEQSDKPAQMMLF